MYTRKMKRNIITVNIVKKASLLKKLKMGQHLDTKLLQILQKLTKKEITIITVTHDVEFAAQSADRVGMLFDGQFVSVDTPVRFFSENSFYTTAANRISRGIYDGAILCEQVVELCRLNGTKDGDCE